MDCMKMSSEGTKPFTTMLEGIKSTKITKNDHYWRNKCNKIFIMNLEAKKKKKKST